MKYVVQGDESMSCNGLSSGEKGICVDFNRPNPGS